MRALLLISMILCVVPGFAESEVKSVSLGVHLSETIRIPRLKRIAVANGKIVKAKALPPSTLLLTGLSAGETMIRAWDDGEKETAYLVRVLKGRSPSSPKERAEVVKVAIEFLEMNEAFGSQTGFRWPEMISFSSMAGVQGTQNVSGLNYEATLSTAKGWIQHMVQEGWAKVLASPEMYVRLGEQAVFQSGGEFPVSTSLENYGRVHRAVEWKTYGLTAKVRPESGDGIHIASDILLEVSELNGAKNADGIPSLTKRHLTTKMNSLDGQTVLLSGLVRQASTSRKEGIPILSSIPLIGYFFSARSESREETELLMAVTFSLSTRSREMETRENFQRRWDNP